MPSTRPPARARAPNASARARTASARRPCRPRRPAWGPPRRTQPLRPGERVLDGLALLGHRGEDEVGRPVHDPVQRGDAVRREGLAQGPDDGDAAADRGLVVHVDALLPRRAGRSPRPSREQRLVRGDDVLPALERAATSSNAASMPPMSSTTTATSGPERSSSRVVTSAAIDVDARDFSVSRTAIRRTAMRAPSRASMSPACLRGSTAPRRRRCRSPRSRSRPHASLISLRPVRLEHRADLEGDLPVDHRVVSIRTGPTPGAYVISRTFGPGVDRLWARTRTQPRNSRGRLEGLADRGDLVPLGGAHRYDRDPARPGGDGPAQEPPLAVVQAVGVGAELAALAVAEVAVRVRSRIRTVRGWPRRSGGSEGDSSR